MMIYGWKSMGKEKEVQGQAFRNVMIEKERDNPEYIQLLTMNHELKTQLSTIENKLETMLLYMENIEKEKEKKQEDQGNIEEIFQEKFPPEYRHRAEQIEKMTKEDKSLEEIAVALNMGKGEVLFIQRLLEK